MTVGIRFPVSQIPEIKHSLGVNFLLLNLRPECQNLVKEFEAIFKTKTICSLNFCKG